MGILRKESEVKYMEKIDAEKLRGLSLIGVITIMIGKINEIIDELNNQNKET